MKSSTTITTPPLAVLLVGEPKGGKSSAMLSFSSFGNPSDIAVIDWDQNLGSAMRRAKGAPFDFFQPAVADKDIKLPNGTLIPEGAKVPEEYQYARAVEETMAVLKNPQYKVVAIDGLGILALMLCEHIIRETKASGSNKTGRMELQNYADLSRLIRNYIMTIRSSGKTIVVTSHLTGDKDEATGIWRYFLAVPGQSKDTLGGAFTDVWMCRKTTKGLNEEVYEIRTRANAQYNSLGASFEFPEQGALNVTNKSPQEIRAILQPRISAK